MFGSFAPLSDDPVAEACAISIARGYALAYRQVGISVISLVVASDIGRTWFGTPSPIITTEPPDFVACRYWSMIQKSGGNQQRDDLHILMIASTTPHLYILMSTEPSLQTCHLPTPIWRSVLQFPSLS